MVLIYKMVTQNTFRTCKESKGLLENKNYSRRAHRIPSYHVV